MLYFFGNLVYNVSKKGAVNLNLDTKALTEHIYFAENLKAAVEELAVTQAQLAEAIGKNQKTVGRYIFGETYPEGSVARIAEYLLSRSVDENYFVHIPSEKFEEFFSNIYNFFQDNGIHEAEFAKMIGISQKTLNKYHNYRFKTGETLKLSTEMQHKIIDAFGEVDGRFFAFHPDDDDEIQAATREQYYGIVRKVNCYKGSRIVSSVRETWEHLIESFESGNTNFFVYAPEKLELVCFYLHYMIGGIDKMQHAAEYELFENGVCPDYFLQEDIALLDFLYGSHEDLETEDFGQWTFDNDQTPNYWCGLVCMDIGRYREIYAAFSPQEMDETNALLRSVYNSKMRKVSQEREFLKTLNFSPVNYNFNEEKSKKEKVLIEELDELVDLFAWQPPELQIVILRCFDVFFWGISFDDLDEVLAAHKRLTSVCSDDKLKFIEKYEVKIIGDFWNTGRKLDSDYYEKYDDKNAGLWEECSQYLQLMSYARDAKTIAFYNPANEYAKEFKMRCRRLAKDISPAYIFAVQVHYSPVDWYVNMLADIALLKGMDLEEMLRQIKDK